MNKFQHCHQPAAAHEWIQQPVQKLAAGGHLQQWLRTNVKNGYVTKSPTTRFVARWTTVEMIAGTPELKMNKDNFETLEAAREFLEVVAREV